MIYVVDNNTHIVLDDRQRFYVVQRQVRELKQIINNASMLRAATRNKFCFVFAIVLNL